MRAEKNQNFVGAKHRCYSEEILPLRVRRRSKSKQAPSCLHGGPSQLRPESADGRRMHFHADLARSNRVPCQGCTTDACLAVISVCEVHLHRRHSEQNAHPLSQAPLGQLFSLEACPGQTAPSQEKRVSTRLTPPETADLLDVSCCMVSCWECARRAGF